MNACCLYLLPFLSLFNTLASVLVVFWLFQRYRRVREACLHAFAKSALESFPLKELIDQQFDEGTLRHLLEQRYDGFIAALKRRIPMAELMMTGTLEAGLKEQVQSEISKLLPEIKARVLDRLKPDEIQEKILVSLMKMGRGPLRIPLKSQLVMIFYLAAVSLIWGLLQLVFFRMFT